MMQVIFLTAFLLIAVNFVSAINVVNTLPCSEGERCIGFLECLNDTSICFASYSRISFTEATYRIQFRLNTDMLVVEGATDVFILGNNSTILCEQRTGFSFLGVTNLRIEGVQFSMCGAIIPEEIQSRLYLTKYKNSGFFMSRGNRAALLLGNISGLILQRAGVHHSYGYGLLIINSLRRINISSSNFSYNNYHVLSCYQDNVINISCCRDLPSSNNSEGNCNGGNVVIVNTDKVPDDGHLFMFIINTRITHGVNLDTQYFFNASYMYTSGGLSLLISNSRYNGYITIDQCTLASNVGHHSGNAVLYIHDRFGQDTRITFQRTKILNGNARFQLFENTAQSGGLTVRYGYFNSNSVHPDYGLVKTVLIEQSTFQGNRGYTAGAILYQSHIVRDISLQAIIEIQTTTILENFGYDTICTIQGNKGNYLHGVRLIMRYVSLIDNRLISQPPSPTEKLIAYSHSPHVSALHIAGLDSVDLVGMKIQGNIFSGISLTNLIGAGTLQILLGENVRIPTFHGENIIASNRGINGGGMVLNVARIALFNSSARLYLINNTASLTGGAIYVASRPINNRAYQTSDACFFTPTENQCDQPHTRNIILADNSAAVSGNSIYGGGIETCFTVCPHSILTGLTYFNISFDVPWNNSLTEVTSDVEKLCFCLNRQPECDLNSWPVSTYPGGHVHIPAVAVGQLQGTNPAVVIASSNGTSIEEGDIRQQLGVNCQDLNYTIHSAEHVLLEIQLGVNNREFATNQVISVNVTECPQGFELDETLTCSCVALLEKHGVTCLLELQSFQRPVAVWIGYNEATGELLAHSKCPLKKCRQDPEMTAFSLNTTDTQCGTSFSGVLCGSCSGNLSVTFGKIKCKKCSSAFSALVLVIFTITGPLLIITLLLGDLTVERGTFNGFILYVNIVYIHRSLFFGLNHTSVMTVLLAWLNLDLGLELCFYHGMDFYTRQWLQYFFPAYVIFLACILRYLNWYTTLGAKVIRNNITSVLCTLILLSYTKLLRTVAESLSYTSIESSLGRHRKVWLYDGNVPYMEGKHLGLSMAALAVLLLFIFPYTFLLMFEYPLQKFKTHKMLSGLRLLSLIAVYQKPYKKQQRWWTGAILLARVLLVTLYQVSLVRNEGLNKIVIVTLGLCILGAMWNIGGLYKKSHVTMLEAFYLVNLVLLAGWSEYVSTSRNQMILSYVLVTLAWLAFLVTAFFPLVRCCINYFIKKGHAKRSEGVHNDNFLNMTNAEGVACAPSSTYISVTGDKEPLSQLQ